MRLSSSTPPRRRTGGKEEKNGNEENGENYIVNWKIMHEKKKRRREGLRRVDLIFSIKYKQRLTDQYVAGPATLSSTAFERPLRVPPSRFKLI